VTVLLSPYVPESTAKLLAALGDERLELAAAVYGEGPGGRAIGALAPLFPKPQ
jgi:methionyl-tRNA synthetase